MVIGLVMLIQMNKGGRTLGGGNNNNVDVVGGNTPLRNNKNKGIQNDNGKLLKKLEESQRQKNPNYQESSTNNLHVSNHPLGLFAF
ncbi:2188_t:CDS:2 [Entrophospora sp. SA101]|nr:2188_t:CDS:2 [Entrophospora sp. SA101]CAJ0920691.1 9500_t:CDS:2 [Entrophospora sp. SA101]